MPDKFLIIRFSSFGDIMQCLPTVAYLHREHPHAEIHFVTRADFAEVIAAYRLHAGVNPFKKIWSLDRAAGMRGLFQLARELKRERFTHAYDAHSNLRSFVLTAILRAANVKLQFVRRPKNRFRRILLFWFRIHLFPKPFRGADSYLKPIQKWLKVLPATPGFHASFDFSNVTLPALPQHPQTGRQAELHDCIALIPGAAWPLKEWPKNHWQELITMLTHTHTKTLDKPVIILGGKNDVICQNLCAPSENCLNLAGQLTWLQCLKIVSSAKFIIAGDTGLMHAADLLSRPVVALIGPTAFGFPSRVTSQVLDVPLSCRPCTKDGRGRCRNKEYKSCLVQIRPSRVVDAIQTQTIQTEAVHDL